MIALYRSLIAAMLADRILEYIPESVRNNPDGSVPMVLNLRKCQTAIRAARSLHRQKQYDSRIRHCPYERGIWQSEFSSLRIFCFVFFAPIPHGIQDRFQAVSKFCQCVFYMRRHFRINSADDQTAFFHLPELCG